MENNTKSLVNLKKNHSIELSLISQKRLSSILNLQGAITINGEKVEAYEAVLFRNEDKLVIKGLEDTSFLFLE